MKKFALIGGVEYKNIRKFSNMSDEEWDDIKDHHAVNKKFYLNKRAKNLLEVKIILDRLKISFFLTHGALLGIYRDGGFIKSDNDIEIDVFEEIFKKNHKEMKEEFIKSGFIVRSTKIKKSKSGGKLNLFRYKEKISIRSIYLIPNYKQGQYRFTNNFKYSKKFYDNPDNIEFENKIFQTPGPIEEYLIYTYGDNWRKPISKNKMLKKWRKMEVRRSSKERRRKK